MGKKSRIPLRWVLVLLCLAALALVDVPVLEPLADALPWLLPLVALGVAFRFFQRKRQRVAAVPPHATRRDAFWQEEWQARRRLARLRAGYARVHASLVGLRRSFPETAQSPAMQKARTEAEAAAREFRGWIARERAILLSIEVHRWLDELGPLVQALESEGEWPDGRWDAHDYHAWIFARLEQLHATRERGVRLRGQILADRDLAELPLAREIQGLLARGLERSAVLRGDLLGLRADLQKLCSQASTRDPEYNAHRCAEAIRAFRQRRRLRPANPSVPKAAEAAQLHLRL